MQCSKTSTDFRLFCKEFDLDWCKMVMHAFLLRSISATIPLHCSISCKSRQASKQCRISSFQIKSYMKTLTRKKKSSTRLLNPHKAQPAKWHAIFQIRKSSHRIPAPFSGKKNKSQVPFYHRSPKTFFEVPSWNQMDDSLRHKDFLAGIDERVCAANHWNCDMRGTTSIPTATKTMKKKYFLQEKTCTGTTHHNLSATTTA